MLTPHYGEREIVVKELDSDVKSGLSHQQVVQNREAFGENKLREGKRKTTFQKFIDQFKDVMIIILLLAALISFIVALGEHDRSAFFEPLLILLIVVLNAIMGVIQENKAEKAMDALLKLSSPHARVIREGKQQMVDAKDLVVGDIIILQDGDYVPADARLLQSSSLKVEESALTGESVPSQKDADALVEVDAPLGDRLNMVYSGCSVTYGSAVAIVTQIGMDTEMGKIAGLLETAEETKTPLQLKLAQLGKYLGILAIVVCVIIFVMGIIDGMPIMEIFMTSVSLAVSAIPEGLPVIVTVVLSLGVSKMAKRNAIVKKLPAVETLGSTSVICSDKTGTLTQNKMTLMKIYTAADQELKDVETAADEASQQLLRYSVLCCDATIEQDGDKVVELGDPTETCIISALLKHGGNPQQLNERYPRLYEVPFDSDRKLMTSINRIDKQAIVIVKGAYDILMSRCIDGDFECANKRMVEMSEEALRVIAVAYKSIEWNEDVIPSVEELESGLTFLGLLGMIDPPRKEAQQAVALCKKAGIKPVMITGDHIVTASAIAKQLGILEEGDQAISGAELAKLSESELDSRIAQLCVYARVTPQDKIRVVKAWQKKGAIVSMTGDGVNDAPALKAADIGCAMGITGTDVAKGAADLTLMDDNFSTIVEAVKEGRGIYNNIRKTVGFLLGTNIGEVVLVFLSMLFWKQAPLLSMQLLWINLVTDSLPAIALGMEPIEDDVMSQKPRDKNESIFAHRLGIRIALQGLMFGLLAIISFRIGWVSTGDIASGRTMTFMTLALSQVIHSFNMKSNKSLFKQHVFNNSLLNKAVVLSFVMVFVVLFVPGIVDIFGLTYLSFDLYMIGLGLAFVPVIVIELLKAMKVIK